MNEKRLCKSLDALMWFIDESLGIDREKNKLSGFNLIVPFLEASAHNSYIETVSNKSDIIYLRIKESLIGMTEYAYLNYIKKIVSNIKLNEKRVILAFDYTDEDFYGDVQGFNIHGWTGEKGITGKFKFLTCSIVAECAPVKIPLISVPISLGHYKSSTILYCLSLIKEFIGGIDLILFDRGFYDKDLMYELTKLKYPYLIFVPKHDDKKSILYPMDKGMQVAIYNEFVIYKKRWRIETQFRVQDEARIKCKSTDMKIRYLLFMFEQMLQTIWICFYKEEASFKEFLIALAKMSRKWTKT